MKLFERLFGPKPKPVQAVCWCDQCKAYHLHELEGEPYGGKWHCLVCGHCHDAKVVNPKQLS